MTLLAIKRLQFEWPQSAATAAVVVPQVAITEVFPPWFKKAPMASMAEHTHYKLLLHLDGISLSSRLHKIMRLNSAVLKEVRAAQRSRGHDNSACQGKRDGRRRGGEEGGKRLSALL